MVPGVAIVLCFAAGVLLLLHHGWKHDQEDPATSVAKQESCPEVCYFQMSDVCNFRTCNHETWIIFFFALGTSGVAWNLWLSF
jgi:hypothetical protein